MAAAGRIVVGTSGWVYPYWKGHFYPVDLPQAKWFDHYASRFRSVEVNNTFYRMPTVKAVAGWAERAPEGFTYAFKASRYITHVKRLKDPHEPVRNFLDRMRPAVDKTGVILFQLPPNMKRDAERLRGFLKVLPQGEAPYAVEFRHESWCAPETYDLLGEHGVGLCIHDFGHWGHPQPVVVTADVIYLRFHGSGGAYWGRYEEKLLKPWAERMAEWADAGHTVFAYFNNDHIAQATQDAWLLGQLVEKRWGARVLSAPGVASAGARQSTL